MNLSLGMAKPANQLEERMLIRVALELRAENYRENTKSIFEAIKPLTTAIENKLNSKREQPSEIRWEDVGVEGDWLKLIALIPEDAQYARKMLLKVKLDVLEIKDEQELRRVVDAMPHFDASEPEEEELSYDVEQIRLHNLLVLAGYDTHDLALTKDQMRQILVAHRTLDFQRKH